MIGVIPIVAAVIDPNWKWYIALALLTTAVGVGVPMAMRVMREARGEIEPEAEEDLLAPLSEAFAAGQMSADEYERIRASMTKGDAEPWVAPTKRHVKPTMIPTPTEPSEPDDPAASFNMEKS